MTNMLTILLITNTVETFEPIMGMVGKPPGANPFTLEANIGKVGENKEIKLLTTTVSKKTSATIEGVPFEKIEPLTNWTIRYKRVEAWVVDTNPPAQNRFNYPIIGW